MPNDDAVDRNLQGMDELDFLGNDEFSRAYRDQCLAPAAQRHRRYGHRALRVKRLDLVISPMSHLAGRWSELLPWGILVAGLLFTIGLVAMTERLIRQRQRVEQLAEENRRLYGEQRNVSLTLQQSLLPKALPTINGVEFVAGFIPGRDWYSAIAIDDHRFAFVLGDVSAEGWLRRQSWRDFANISCVRFTY